MRVLVTGGAGFIGSNFLQMFVGRKPEHTFVCFDKLTYAGNLLSLEEISSAPNFAFEKGDVADPADVDRVFEQHRPDAVVHFAAESHVDRSIHDPGAFVRTNVNGTLTLLLACKKLWEGGGGSERSGQAHRFHHVSTDEVYGSLTEHDPAFTEETRYDPSSPYAASKAGSDHLVRAFHRTYGIPVTLTNCSNNYGARQGPEKLVPLTLLNALEGRELPVYGTGTNRRDWLYVDDHCEAIWTVLERGVVGQTYNIGGGDEQCNIDVVKTICRLVAEETGKSEDSVLGLIRFVKDRPGHDWRYAIDATKVHGALGWEPKVRIAEGLRETLRWYVKNPRWVESMKSGEHRQWVEKNYGSRK
ncbi:MAG: dTDP-glucose 4,6-dehydratase [Polyangiaceae bacterium]